MYMNADMRKKRIEIINKINALSPKCNCQTAVDSESCSNCKEVAKLGQKLLSLVNKRNTKILDSNNDLPVKSSKLDLTKEKYLALKAANKTDASIAMMLNVTPGTIKNWKKINNIVTKPLRGKRYSM